MNLVLLDPSELRPDGTARLVDRRAAHVAGILGARPGDRIRAGFVDGRMGPAEVVSVSAGEVVLRPALDQDPPPPSPVSLLVALPRPKILRKVLQAAASIGVKRVVLLGSYRVEKSYFASPLLSPQAMRDQLLLGLEQGGDTVVPEVIVRRFFKPFVEDELEACFPERTRWLAHPGGAPIESLPRGDGRAVLAIGPEGGWTPYEAEELRRRGFAAFSLGPRVLRVDAAVPYALGQAELRLRSGSV